VLHVLNCTIMSYAVFTFQMSYLVNSGLLIRPKADQIASLFGELLTNRILY
jgi:hypothetical protein